MERVLSQDERIRRAEEIYARRQNIRERTRNATVNVSEPRNFKLFKRIILQAVICVLIYFIFYLVNTTNYSFSETALNKTDELISEEIDFYGILSECFNTINSFFKNLQSELNNNIIENSIDNGVTNEVGLEDTNNIKEAISQEQIIANTNEVSIAEEVIVKEENQEKNENDENIEQEKASNEKLSETDRIKQKYSFINPINRKSVI